MTTRVIQKRTVDQLFIDPGDLTIEVGSLSVTVRIANSWLNGAIVPVEVALSEHALADWIGLLTEAQRLFQARGKR